MLPPRGAGEQLTNSSFSAGGPGGDKYQRYESDNNRFARKGPLSARGKIMTNNAVREESRLGEENYRELKN